MAIMTKDEFVQKLMLCAELPSLYVKGGFGHTASESNKQRLINQYSYNARREDLINAAKYGTFFYDCVGLPKAIAWGFVGNPDLVYGGAVYKANGVPDEDEQAMMDSCLDISTDFSEIKIGEALGISGHIGFYVGNGKAIECTPSGTNGVQYSWVANIAGNKPNELTRIWYRHGKLPFIDYSDPTPPQPPKPKRVEIDGSWGRSTSFNFQDVLGCVELDAVISRQPKGNRGNLPNVVVKDSDNPRGSWEFKGFPANLGGSAAIKAWQRHLKGLGYYNGAIDGWCGPQTITASQLYLRDAGYYTGEIDASMGPLTVMAFQMWINAQ